MRKPHWCANHPGRPAEVKVRPPAVSDGIDLHEINGPINYCHECVMRLIDKIGDQYLSYQVVILGHFDYSTVTDPRLEALT